MILNKAVIDSKVLNIIVLEVEEEVAKSLIIDLTNHFIGIIELDVHELDTLETVRELTPTEVNLVQKIINDYNEALHSISKNTEKTSLTYKDITPLLNKYGYKNLCDLMVTNTIVISKTISVNVSGNMVELNKNYLSNFVSIINAPELTADRFINIFMNTYDFKDVETQQSNNKCECKCKCSNINKDIDSTPSLLEVIVSLANA